MPISVLCAHVNHYVKLQVQPVQTYERAAILDWWARGHKTCPATNTNLNSFQLAPNYVLKRYAVIPYS